MKKLTLILTFLLASLYGAAQITCPTSFSVSSSNLRLNWGSVAATPTGISTIDFENTTNTTQQFGVTGVLAGSGKRWTTNTGTFTATDITGNGSIHIHHDGGTLTCGFTGGALPIELMYFKGEVVNGNTMLTWATASEQDNSHFTIERSIDNSNWEIVSVINGAGNSVNILNYEFTDYSPVNGTVYYRLRQDDYNGDYTYANTIAINNENNAKLNIMGLYVENNTLRVSLEGSTQNEPVTVRIYSLVGSVERIETVEMNEFNNNMVNLDVSSLSGGVYTITVTQGNTQSSGKFIK